MKELKKLLYLFIAATLVVGCSDDNDDEPDPLVVPGNYTRRDVTYNGRRVIQFEVPGSALPGAAQGTGTVTWVSNENGVPVEYLLNGFVYVNSGQTLTIEPGTVVKGKTGAGASASALLVARGARIQAVGTAANPIIMTWEGDDVLNNNETNDRARSQWGGLEILGAAPTNLGITTRQVEGTPSGEPRAQYGGTVANDNSGTIRYVSIRNSGSVISGGSELQGLTLAGVGSGTVIDNIEVLFSGDDGIEIFGGTVNLRNIVIAFAEDDDFDTDQGWSGNAQFVFGYKSNEGVDPSNRSMELDGDDAAETGNPITTDGTPYATGRMANFTMIGKKAGGGDGNRAVEYRNNAAYSIWNSLIADATLGLRVDFNADGSTVAPTIKSAYTHLITDARGRIAGNVWTNIGATPAADDVSVVTIDGAAATADDLTALRNYIAAGNTIKAEKLLSYPDAGRSTPGASKVNPVLPAGTTGLPTVATLPTGGFLTQANYIGAFDPAVASASQWYSWTLFYNLYVRP